MLIANQGKAAVAMLEIEAVISNNLEVVSMLDGALIVHRVMLVAAIVYGHLDDDLV
jgi:hypothetical protein